ncbi:MAG: hypothetical protein MUE44_31745 [Oscillatoriaceae cyanobacterium Prado104]|nr:hypothetical protein [Oscillatoriaceae cyanobacterium Prado104]
MKRVSLLALPAAAWLLGFSNLTGFDRTASNYFGNSPSVLAQNQSQPPQDCWRPPRIDFSAAAKQLGITEVKLIAALGLPAKPPAPPTGNNPPPYLPPPPPLDISGAAKKLGVTEAELIKALGIPPRPPGRDM